MPVRTVSVVFECAQLDAHLLDVAVGIEVRDPPDALLFHPPQRQEDVQLLLLQRRKAERRLVRVSGLLLPTAVARADGFHAARGDRRGALPAAVLVTASPVVELAVRSRAAALPRVHQVVDAERPF
jgi:hypothetical protein